MSRRLDDARLKLERASQHISDLRQRAAEFFESEPYRIETRVVGDQRQYFVRTDSQPPALSPIAGDAIHNLRAALDLAACQVVRDNGGPVRRSTGFPVADSESSIRSLARGRLRGARRDVLEAVVALRPYRGGNDDLWTLHRLDIIDKHQVLTTAGMAYRAFTFDIGKHFERTISPELREGFTPVPSVPLSIAPADKLFPLKDGDQVFGEPADEPSVEPSFTFDLCLAAESFDPVPVNDLMIRLHQAAEHAIGNMETAA